MSLSEPDLKRQEDVAPPSPWVSRRTGVLEPSHDQHHSLELAKAAFHPARSARDMTNCASRNVRLQEIDS